MSAIPFIRRTSNERVDGTLTVKIDIDLRYKLQFLQLFPEIGCMGALAALKQDPQEPQQEEKPKGGPLAKLAAMWCQQETFWQFLNSKFFEGYDVGSEEDAARLIRILCCIDSRSEIDSDPKATQIFHEQIRIPYISYMQDK